MEKLTGKILKTLWCCWTRRTLSKVC